MSYNPVIWSEGGGERGALIAGWGGGQIPVNWYAGWEYLTMISDREIKTNILF